MSKIIALILSFFASIFPPATTQVFIKNQPFKLEIAKNPIEKATGLMFRQNLCSNCGMLFIFGSEAIYPFWMQNTFIPLDIIWLDQDGTVVDLKTGQPKNPELLSNSAPAKYVLETNPGATNLKIGDQIQLKL